VTAVKCVVWDLDGTVWPGVAIEAPEGEPLRPYRQILQAMTLLEERGIVNSVASRTDPAVAETVESHPDLAGRFVAPQLGWGDKSEAILRVAETLRIDPEAIAFVDDNAFERAEVAAMLPRVLVLAPQELFERLDTPAFRPATGTAEARARVDRYRDDERRREANAAFAGTREEFLRTCDIRLTVGRAEPGDVERVVELVERTHRFNTTGERWDPARIRSIVDDPQWLVPVARLTDRFGEYGLIGTALVQRNPDGRAAWRLRLFMVSCRAAGRDVPVALLGWLIRRARADGAREMLVDVRPGPANVELRVLLRRAGFSKLARETTPGRGAAGDSSTDPTIMLSRPVDEDLPDVPWLSLADSGW
jgi:FkbH-like protein